DWRRRRVRWRSQRRERRRRARRNGWTEWALRRRHGRQWGWLRVRGRSQRHEWRRRRRLWWRRLRRGRSWGWRRRQHGTCGDDLRAREQRRRLGDQRRRRLDRHYAPVRIAKL